MSEKPHEKTFDCLVVGAGIVGSSTARYSASLGKKTLCIEQFPIPHSRGSSHGQSRITRHSYEEDYYADMMPEAFALWEEIEQLAKEKLFINCGYLTIDGPPYSSLNNVAENLKSNCIATESVTSQQLKEKYMFFDFPSDIVGLLEKPGGMLLANKCLRAVQEQFITFGGVLRDNETVLDIIPGDIVQVKTNKQNYKARTVILTPGPWATSLVKPLGINLNLQPICASACYWKVKQTGFNALDDYPCWMDHTDEMKQTCNGSIYGLPCYEYPNMVKICLDTGPAVHPDARGDVDIEWVKNNVSKYIKRHLIGVDSKPSVVENCLYTATPDRICIMDKHPKLKNVVFGIGFSGSGFKLAPVFGKILVKLAFGLQPNYNIEPFKMDRFQNATFKSSL